MSVSAGLGANLIKASHTGEKEEKEALLLALPGGQVLP